MKEEYGHLDCNTMQFRESLKFQRNKPSASSGSKRKPSKKPEEAGRKVNKQCTENWPDTGQSKPERTVR
jgi:hypothetical protein